MASIIDFLGKKVFLDENRGGYIWAEDEEGGLQMIAEMRGWGAIQNLFKLEEDGIDFEKAEDFQDDLGKWIADAINEKLERERKNK